MRTLLRVFSLVILGLVLALSSVSCAGANDFLARNETQVVKAGETLRKAAKALELLDLFVGDQLGGNVSPEQLDALGVAVLGVADAEKELRSAAASLKEFQVAEAKAAVWRAVLDMQDACKALQKAGYDVSKVSDILDELHKELEYLP